HIGHPTTIIVEFSENAWLLPFGSNHDHAKRAFQSLWIVRRHRYFRVSTVPKPGMFALFPLPSINLFKQWCIHVSAHSNDKTNVVINASVHNCKIAVPAVASQISMQMPGCAREYFSNDVMRVFAGVGVSRADIDRVLKAVLVVSMQRI